MILLPHLNICSFQCQHLHGTFFAPISFSAILNYNWCKFIITILKIHAETALSKGTFCDKFIMQYKHQLIKKRTIFKAKLEFIFAKKCRFNTHFSWKWYIYQSVRILIKSFALRAKQDSLMIYFYKNILYCFMVLFEYSLLLSSPKLQ